jgi:ubiquinone/menaquinone biosynthesis C-methylase UbiE
MVGVGLFDRQAEAYARYRPTYPHSLYKHILKYCNFHSEPECALDIACGSGQATAELAEYFKKVITVPSEHTDGIIG